MIIVNIAKKYEILEMVAFKSHSIQKYMKQVYKLTINHIIENRRPKFKIEQQLKAMLSMNCVSPVKRNV